MNVLFLAMLTGHLIADFWLQPLKWIKSKQEKGWKSRYLFFHSGIASILPIFFTFQIELWWFVPIIFTLHFFIDLFKTKTNDNLFAFLIDQALHVGLLFFLASFATTMNLQYIFSTQWIYGAGFVFLTTPVGILIGKFLQLITNTENKPILNDTSAWIGIIERLLILIFILSEQFQAIGFLVAAKSVFRFGELKKEGNSKAEYFLLGTLVSFLVAIVIGLGIKFVT